MAEDCVAEGGARCLGSREISDSACCARRTRCTRSPRSASTRCGPRRGSRRRRRDARSAWASCLLPLGRGFLTGTVDVSALDATSAAGTPATAGTAPAATRRSPTRVRSSLADLGRLDPLADQVVGARY